GTYINGERVRGEGMLKHGDEIALGATRARFDDGSGLSTGASAQAGPVQAVAPAAAPAWQPAAPMGSAPAGPHGTVPRQAPGSGLPPVAAPPQFGTPLAGPSPLAQSNLDAPTRPGPSPFAQHAPVHAPPIHPFGATPAGQQPFHGTRIDVQDQARAIG